MRAFLTLWGETANEVLLETQRTDAFLETQREVLKASTDLRLAQRTVAEFYSEMYGYPTRAELDDVHKTVTELRRELRALKRSIPRTAPLPQAHESQPEPKAPRQRASPAREGRARIETQRDTLMSKSMSPVDIRPEQVAAEVAALGEKIARGTKLFQDVRDEDVAIATTPKDEIWRQDKVTLHHYQASHRGEGPDTGPDRLRPHRALHHGGLAGGPLARPQPAQSGRRPVRGRLGQSFPGRPLGDHRRLCRRLPGRVRAGHLRNAMASSGSTCSASARAACSRPAMPPCIRRRSKAWC